MVRDTFLFSSFSVMGKGRGETPALLQQMDTAVTQAEAATMQKAAHTLKSSSASLGAIALSKFCQQLENLGRS
jgi:HPt (histidine-containing phosphotransfer) domain-containing protein